MTVGPDDLPSAGAQQVICGCLTDLFRVVLNGGIEIVAECSGCGSTANRWPTLAGLGPLTGGEQIIGPRRDVLQQPMVGAAWGEGPPVASGTAGSEAEIRKAMAGPPLLPAYSADTCNAFLEGGPYDGQTTWVMNAGPHSEFHISGVASYHGTPRSRDGRVVFEHRPPGTVP